jgi:hypothetical protein
LNFKLPNGACLNSVLAAIKNQSLPPHLVDKKITAALPPNKEIQHQQLRQTSRNGTFKQVQLAENFGEFEGFFQRDFVLKNSCLFGVSVLHCVGHFFVALLQPA